MANATVALDHNQSNYLCNVLRLGSGSRVLAFNGLDGEWRTRLERSGKRAATLIAEDLVRPQPPVRDVTLFFAPLKHARLDYLVQKAVEMGVTRLAPVLTARTQVQRVNLERMRANAIEAAEQCGILSIPEIREPSRFDAALATLSKSELLIFCDEDAEIANPFDVLRKAPAASTIALLIGPEGGFDPAERARIISAPGVARISLGPRILRADTAAVAALAIAQAALGEWRGFETRGLEATVVEKISKACPNHDLAILSE